MNRNAFKQLLKRYIAGTANDTEKNLVDHWYELLYNENITTLSEQELNSIEQEMWDKIEQEGNFATMTTEKAALPKHIIMFRWAAAAAIIIAVSIGIYTLTLSPQKSITYQQSKDQNNLAEVVNSSSAIRKLQLEDGTIIMLKPHSRLAYPDRFSADTREVFLEGEAFFDVAKDPVKPFLVHSGNLVTQVLGTSFTIKPDRESNKIVVSVKTGRVVVFEDKKNNGAIITPNQSVIYDADNRSFTTSLVDNPEPVVADSNSIVIPVSFSFDETNLGTVLGNVGKVYGIEIMVENENIYHCRFSGDITKQSLFDKLELICQSTNHQYEIKGTKILIKGKGCN